MSKIQEKQVQLKRVCSTQEVKRDVLKADLEQAGKNNADNSERIPEFESDRESTTPMILELVLAARDLETAKSKLDVAKHYCKEVVLGNFQRSEVPKRLGLETQNRADCYSMT